MIREVKLSTMPKLAASGDDKRLHSHFIIL